MNTRPSRSRSRVSTTWSVKPSQPLPWCAPARPSSTVSTALSSSTPCRAHGSRQPWSGRGDAEVALDLLEDVVQRRRHRHARRHREAQAVRLAGAVVRVLAEDHHLHRVERRRVERGEDLRPRRDRCARPRPCARAGTPTAPACRRVAGSRRRAPSTTAPAGCGRRSWRSAASDAMRCATRHAFRCSGICDSRSWNSSLVTSRRSSIGLSTRSLAPARSSAALVVAVGVAGHHQHRQAALAVAEVAADRAAAGRCR